MTARPVRLLLGAILVVAAAFRLWGLDFGLPHTQARPDETQVIDTALSFLQGRLPRFYDYPWLYIWMLTLFYLGYYAWGLAAGSVHTVADFAAAYELHWEPFFMISRALSATAGTLTVYLVYRLARHLWDVTTALIAALFFALAFLAVRESHFGTTDATMTMLIVAAVVVLMRAHRSGRASLFAAAGVVAGLATATKYNAVFLVVPMVVVQLLRSVDASGRRLATFFDRSLILFAAGFALALCLGIPFVFLDWPRFSLAMRELIHSTQHGMGNAQLEPGWIHHLKFSLRYGVGLPLLIAGLAGAAALVVLQWRSAALLLAFPIAYYLVVGSAGNLFFRYALPVVPFLCLTAAWAVTQAAALIAGRRGDARPRNGAALAILTALAIVIPSAISCWQFDRIMAATDNRVVIANWFKQSVPKGDSVLQSGSSYGYAPIDDSVWTPWTWDSPSQSFRVRGQPAAGRPDWILLQESPLPSSTQAIVKQFLEEDYQVAWQFTAFARGRARVYDRQDAFFVPYAGFEGVERPGPNFTLYRRASAKSGNAPSP